MFRRVGTERLNLHERIVDEVKRALLDGRLKPGDRLPSEAELSKELGVSRASLREAMKILVGEGLLTIRHGQGAFVAEQDPSEVLNEVSRALLFHRGTVQDLFEVRKVLETRAAELAAERASEQEIEEIDALLREYIAKADNGLLDENGYKRYDNQFHALVTHASHNAVLVQVMDSLMDLLGEVRRMSLRIPGRARRSVDDHVAILEALRNRDPEEAHRRMYEHLSNVEASILSWNRGGNLVSDGQSGPPAQGA